MELLDRVRDTVERRSLFAPGQTVVAAVSGGPDSVALLHALYRLQSELSISPIAAHLDHGFRGAESAADREYVQSLCSTLDIPCHTAFVNVPEQKRQLHLSSQEAARAARHSFLRTVAAKTGAERIALGHTRDDRAETVLLNLLRGTGPSGLAGFPPARFPLVRPLYDVTRAETTAYCAANELEPRLDPSNESLEYRRNRLRRELLPYLAEHFNPQIEGALLRLADIARAESELLDDLAAEALSSVRSNHKTDSLTLRIDAVLRQPEALRGRVLRQAVAEVRGSLHGVEWAPIEAVLTAMNSDKAFAIDLPAGECRPTAIRVDAGIVIVSRRADGQSAEQPDWSVPVEMNGRTVVPGGAIVTVTFARPKDAREALRAAEQRSNVSAADSLLVPLAALNGPLIARSWLPGDRMRPLGMAGRKKLQDLFVDRKIPVWRRRLAPVIVDSAAESSSGGADDRIVGVLGVHASDSCLSLASGTPDAENIGACLLVMALSDADVT